VINNLIPKNLKIGNDQVSVITMPELNIMEVRNDKVNIIFNKVN